MPENSGGSRGSTAGKGSNQIGAGAEGGGCDRGYPLLQIGSRGPPKVFLKNMNARVHLSPFAAVCLFIPPPLTVVFIFCRQSSIIRDAREG